ncbi:MAG: hypothetical protein SGJ02_11045, partial [bacterium]|nr:hypothetical protein [bacterium]
MHQTTSKNRDGAQLFINNWAPSLFFLISILVHLRLSDYAFDDAYIHFRISQNFVSHGYPYYNLGDATMVTSSPIWTMLLSTIFFIFGNNLCSVAILNGVILVLAALTWGNLISEKVSFLKTIIIAALLSVSSFGLMETPLALLFLGIGTFLDKRNDSRAFIFLTLAFFTRFELGIFLILFLIKHWQGRRFSKAAIYTFVTSLPIITFCFHYFATLTPNTISAKSIVYN